MSNPLVAPTEDSTKAYSGISLAETAAGLSDAIKSGDWASVAMGAVGTALDALSMAMDPFGAILAAGVSWLMEHVGPLKEALNGLTGNADEIAAQSQTWANIAKELEGVGSDLGDMVKADLQSWTGPAADAYRQRTQDTVALFQSAQKGCEGASSGVKTAGEVVAAVRTLVRDIISELIGHMISWALQVVFTLGIGLTWVVPQVVAAVAKTASKIADVTTKLVKALKALIPLLKKAGTLFEDAGKALKGLKGGKVEAPPKTSKIDSTPKAPPTKGGGDSTTPSGDHSPPPKTDNSTTPSGDHSPPKDNGSTSPQGDHSPPAKNDPPPDNGPGTSKSDPTPDNGPGTSKSDPTPDNGTHTSGSPKGDPGKGDPLGSGGKKPVDESSPPPDRTAGGDPVDLVTGEMFTTQEDLGLPGVLPVLFERTHVSGYRKGLWFGKEWSSTLDQRVEVDGDGLHYAAADGVVLHYPHPAEDGDLVLPVEGARWPLRWNRESDTVLIGRPESGLTLSFPGVEAGGSVRPLETVGDRHGNWMTFVRGETGAPAELRHSGGYHVRFGHVDTAAGPRIADLRMVRANGPDVTVVAFAYDARGRLEQVADSRGRPMRYEYDDQDRVVAWFDRVGQTYRYHFDESGRVVRTEGTGDVLTGTFAYDLENRVTTQTDSLGHATRYHWNELNQVTKVVDPRGAETVTEYSRFGMKLSTTDPIGRTNRVAPREGRALRQEVSGGASREVVYDQAMRPVRVTGPDGEAWELAYDENGKVVSESGPGGVSRTYAYGARGDLVALTDELGQVTRFRNNAAGLPVEVLEPSGARTRYAHDAFGRVVSVVDPLGGVVRMNWTIEGLPAWRVEPDGSREEWEHDAEGNLLVHSGPSGAETRFEYGPFGEVTARVDPTGARYAYGYDTELRLRKVTGPTGLTWVYEYDAVGNLVLEKDFDGSTRTYSYDAAGQLVRRVNGAGQWASYRYDEQGRLVEHRNEHGSYTRTFDESGRVAAAEGPGHRLEFAYDEAGRIVAETLNGRRTSYTYDALGQVLSRTTPSGAVSSWTYDGTGQPLSLAAAGGRIAFERDAGGQEVARRFGAGIMVRQGFDPLGRVVRQSIHAEQPDGSPSRTLQQRTLTYRADGHPVQIADRIRGTRSFELDDSGRVNAVRAAGWSESYAYDLNGNLVRAETPTARGPVERRVGGTLVHQAADTTYDHDRQGRVVRATRRTASGPRQWSYTWDAEDHLVAVKTPDGSTWRYLYDALDRRIAKRCLDREDKLISETWFAWEGTRIAEQHVTVGGRSDVTTWDWQPGTHRVVAQSRRRARPDQKAVDVAFHAIVTDLVGTPTELVTPDGRITWHTTDLWGADFARPVGEADFPLRFPGQYHDTETGLNYNLNRYYNPATASYLSPDPLGLNPAPNNHAYVDNPLTYLDPLGLICMKGLKEKIKKLNPFKKKQKGPTGPPQYIYRWDGRPNLYGPGRNPANIVEDGGFKPVKPDGTLTLQEHVEGKYAGGGSSKGNSQWVSSGEYSGMNDAQIAAPNSYLYKIDTSQLPDPNKLVNVSDYYKSTGGKEWFPEQKEWAHDGTIPADAIVGYVPGKGNVGKIMDGADPDSLGFKPLSEFGDAPIPQPVRAGPSGSAS
ncbi:MAG TPA: DUF6531 domain-containing protein [Amycolatopsis sp.]